MSSSYYRYPVQSGGGSGSLTLTGAVTGSGTGTVATTLATAPANTLKGNNTAGTASPTDLTVSQVLTLLSLSSSNSPSFAGLTLSGLTTAGILTNTSGGVLGTTTSPSLTGLTVGTLSGVGFFTSGTVSAISGTSAQYIRGDGTAQTLNQAAVSGLTTASSPTFTGLTLSGLSTTGVVHNSSAGLLSTGLVANADLAAAPANTLKGNNQASSLAPTDLTGSQVRTLLGLSTGDSPTFTGLVLSGLGSLGFLTVGSVGGGVNEIAFGTSSQYVRADGTLQTLNQAAVAGLTTADSPTFTGATLSGLTTAGIVANSAAGVLSTTKSPSLTNVTLTGQIIAEEQSAKPSAPASGYLSVYPGIDGRMYAQNSAALELPIAFDIGRQNIFINGNFLIYQRGTSGTTGYVADRWQGDSGVTSQSQVSGPSGALHAHQFSSSGSSVSCSMGQKIERLNVPQSGTLTVSFQMLQSAGTAQNVYVQLLAPTAVDNYSSTTVEGTSGSLGTLTASWQTFTYTFSLTSNMASYGLLIKIFGGSPGTTPSGCTFALAQCMLNTGSAAASFTSAGGTIGGELALCQRYYWRSSPGGSYCSVGSGVVSATSTTTVSAWHTKLPVTMRAIPTIGYSNVEFYDGGSFAAISSIASPWSSLDFLAADINLASALTSGRPAILANNNNTAGYVEANAEL